MSPERALAQVRESPFVLDAIRAADDVGRAAARADGARTAALLAAAAADGNDQLTAIAAVHALGHVLDDCADEALSELLSHDRRHLAEHAAWVLGSRLPRLDAIGRLVTVVADGGFGSMVAQRTLQKWARSAPDHVALALEAACWQRQEPASRARLVETLGLVPGALAARTLVALIADPSETRTVRTAAVAALGDRGDHAERPVLETVAGSDDPLFEAAVQLALLDLSPPDAAASARRASSGVTVAQMFLHADLDRDLTRSGAGDNGGIATLLVRLGDALVRRDRVDRAVTISRGGPAEALEAIAGGGADSHRFAPVPTDGSVASADSWTLRVAVERGVRRVLRHLGPVDAFHLRMADVGSMAARTVCRELGIPTVFSLAPDPHAVVHALDMTGALRHENFGDIDEREHHWFRVRLVERLAQDAAHVVLFPRPQLRDDLVELVGIDVADDAHRYTVVPEGIDVRVSEAARNDLLSGGDRAVTVLDDLVGGLPPERHGLPVAISVGRLHRVKGMATVVEAWATDPDLRARCNLVIVGGDLESPSVAETEQLACIAEVLDQVPAAADGLVLAGHRPNDTVARWLAATRCGTSPNQPRAGRVGSGGVYVCGSLKEEFGLALLEALAAGLVVVAPGGGGPATFVDPGVTGVLVDTRSPHEVASGIAAALDMAARPDSGDRSMATVRERFTIDTMADALGDVYESVAATVRELSEQ